MVDRRWLCMLVSFLLYGCDPGKPEPVKTEHYSGPALNTALNNFAYDKPVIREEEPVEEKPVEEKPAKGIQYTSYHIRCWSGGVKIFDTVIAPDKGKLYTYETEWVWYENKKKRRIKADCMYKEL